MSETNAPPNGALEEDKKRVDSPPSPSEAAMDIYSAGIIPYNWLHGMPGNWYPYFLTDILAMSPALAGTVSLISRIMNLFMQPLAGAMVDRSSPRWGKYRTWIYITVPIASILHILLFLNYTKMGMSIGTTAVLVTVLYILTFAAAAFGQVVHAGLFAAMTPDTRSRVKLTTRRALGMSASQITLGLLAMPLVALLGAGDEGKGFLLTTVLFAVLSVVGFLAIAAVVKPWDPVRRENTVSVPSEAPPPFKEMFSQIFTNPPLGVYLLSDALRWGSRMMLIGFAIYNFKYVFGSPMWVATFMTTVNLVSFVFTFLSEPFTMKYKKDMTYLVGNIILLASMILALLVARNNVILYIALLAIGHIGYGPSAAQPPAYYAECAEWAERRTGKSARTLVMSITYLAPAIGVVLSGALTGYCLAMIGYDPTAQVTPELANGIFQIAALVPAALLALGILAFLYYYARRRHWFGEKYA